MLSHTVGSRPATTFTGSPESIGLAHGKLLKQRIATNIDLLVRRDNVNQMLKTTDVYQRWLDRQLDLFSKNWPWLLTEMEAVASGAGVDYSDIFKLNFPVWSAASMVLGGRSEQQECACLAITLKDGSIALASTLDDGAEVRSGPTKYAPDAGYRFISIGLPGSCGGGRGINSQGLCVGTAGQGLEASSVDRWLSDDAISMSLALRIINQTCATVGDVREFCKQYHFNAGMICVDARGDVLCAHQTPADLYEIPFSKYATLSNAISDDRIIYSLYKAGYTYLNPEHETARFRRGNLIQFCESHHDSCELEDVGDFMGTRKDKDKGSIHNAGTLAIMLGVPQVDKNSAWIREPHLDDGAHFVKYDL